jgi:hypothetical protein
MNTVIHSLTLRVMYYGEMNGSAEICKTIEQTQVFVFDDVHTPCSLIFFYSLSIKGTISEDIGFPAKSCFKNTDLEGEQSIGTFSRWHGMSSGHSCC